jgi:hypothetical protein
MLRIGRWLSRLLNRFSGFGWELYKKSCSDLFTGNETCEEAKAPESKR